MSTTTKLADFAHRAFILGVFSATVYIGVGTVQLVNARIEKNKVLKATWDAEQFDELRRQTEQEMDRQRLEQQARRAQA
ncbi:hypothetical protein BGZ93_005740 [Podila epicladia]|uniref:Cytochrome c oxidase assembly protein n=1 Tax=Podila minutissima TaxID=64525 RepID=A0A9P5SK69_9FUNG|nr:hypothetical protein BGZ74_005494 [Mortierella antarctica]KAF9313173.1 hypothetical protein BG003_005525 [Podila horticola]KAF9328736.1 hypothetical protein BG006_008129 [Podila minutissima]KAG0028004.1 hypothetical protein BGZ81_005109 [Podila clonocystis]KAG0088116.1 hypothetical protein BGZ92_006601 [Podila epicladia]